MTQEHSGKAAPVADEFELYDLRVEVVESERPFVMHVKKGDYFDVIGGRLVFPQDNPSFSLYALLAVLPFIPAKQRPTHPNDWMTTDTLIASTDPACGARFRITRLARRTLHHGDFSVLPLGTAEDAVAREQAGALTPGEFREKAPGKARGTAGG